MVYRTKTYLAGDWDGDRDAIEQIKKWNDSNYWSLHFVDVHEVTQSSDDSLYCSIKKSLSQRMDMCKTFVLVVGKNTTTVTKGACFNCGNYVKEDSASYYGYYYSSPYAQRAAHCSSGGSISNKSYIQFECDKALRDGLRIVVLYNSIYKYPDRCPEVVRDIGIHVAMKKSNGDWDYYAVKDAIMG